MKSRYLSIDSDKIDMLANRIGESSNSINNGVEKSKSGFSSLQSSPNLSEGINKINNNLKAIGDRVDNYNRVVVRQSNVFFEQENILLSAADYIEIPKNLSIVDNIYESKIEESNLSKDDGIKINSNNSNYLKEFNDYSSSHKNDLNSINNNIATQVRNFSDNYVNSKQNLNNIVKNGTETLNYKDEYSNHFVEINNLKNGETKEVNFENNYNNFKTDISNILKKETNLVHYGDSYSDDKISLVNINNKGTNEVSFDPNYSFSNASLDDLVGDNNDNQSR